MKTVKIATLKPNTSTGRAAAYVSWAEQMLLDKLAQYHYTTTVTTFEVEKETEKAFQIRVDTADLINSRTGDDYYGDKDFWYIWMPKSAFGSVRTVNR